MASAAATEGLAELAAGLPRVDWAASGSSGVLTDILSTLEVARCASCTAAAGGEESQDLRAVAAACGSVAAAMPLAALERAVLRATSSGDAPREWSPSRRRCEHGSRDTLWVVERLLSLRAEMQEEEGKEAQSEQQQRRQQQHKQSEPQEQQSQQQQDQQQGKSAPLDAYLSMAAHLCAQLAVPRACVPKYDADTGDVESDWEEANIAEDMVRSQVLARFRERTALVLKTLCAVLRLVDSDSSSSQRRMAPAFAKKLAPLIMAALAPHAQGGHVWDGDAHSRSDVAFILAWLCTASRLKSIEEVLHRFLREVFETLNIKAWSEAGSAPTLLDSLEWCVRTLKHPLLG